MASPVPLSACWAVAVEVQRTVANNASEMQVLILIEFLQAGLNAMKT
jgi:hypothetical protein